VNGLKMVVLLLLTLEAHDAVLGFLKRSIAI
jgi:hypothetical protein